MTGTTLVGLDLELVSVSDDAVSCVTLPAPLMPTSETSTAVRTGLVAVLTTLATRSPDFLSRVTTWNSFSVEAASSYDICSSPSR